MKLTKAIEIGELYAKGVPKHNHTDFEDALLILIEAGKRLDDHRNGKTLPFERWLPGETED